MYKRLVCLLFVIVVAAAIAEGKGAHTQKRGQCDSGRSRQEILAALPPVKCLECEAAVEATRLIIGNNSTEHNIDDIIIFFCKELRIEDQFVCTNVIHEFEDFFWFMLIHEISPKIICAFIDACEMPVYPSWNVTFPTPQPPVKPYPPVVQTNPKLYVLHFSDLHVDPLYTPGLQSKCGEPLCCRPPNKPGVPGNIAGQFGDYNCDLPKWVYEDMLRFIAANLTEINYAIFTGDMPPHDVWAETRNSALEIENYEVDTFKKYLPHIPLFPAVGNHESVPVNEFVPRSISGEWDMSWLYTPLAEMWADWLPADAQRTVKFAGYYTALTPDGTRIVSLNTNLGCNSENWWLTLPSPENADPDQQLHWFAQVMQDAEKANEMVYIIMHIEPGLDCKMEWWTNYYKIIERYQNNIISQFAGHTHDDILHTVYTQDHNATGKYRPFLTTYFAGSVTTYQPINPGFRVYEIDAKTKAIADYREFYANITEANLSGKLVWELEYTAKRDYKMADMSPASWRDMALRAYYDDKTLLEQYASRRGKGQEGCNGDAKCLYGAWCDMWVAPPPLTNICGA